MSNYKNIKSHIVMIILFLAGLSMYGLFLFLVIADVVVEGVPWLPTMLLGAGLTAYACSLFLPGEGSDASDTRGKLSRRQKNTRVQCTLFALLLITGAAGMLIRAEVNERDHQALLERLQMTEQEYAALKEKHSTQKPAETVNPSPSSKQTKAPAAARSAPKTSSKPSASSEFDMKGYTSFDDFYDDYYDDFWDIDEAEEYYYDHGGW